MQVQWCKTLYKSKKLWRLIYLLLSIKTIYSQVQLFLEYIICEFVKHYALYLYIYFQVYKIPVHSDEWTEFNIQIKLKLNEIIPVKLQMILLSSGGGLSDSVCCEWNVGGLWMLLIPN